VQGRRQRSRCRECRKHESRYTSRQRFAAAVVAAVAVTVAVAAAVVNVGVVVVETRGTSEIGDAGSSAASHDLGVGSEDDRVCRKHWGWFAWLVWLRSGGPRDLRTVEAGCARGRGRGGARARVQWCWIAKERSGVGTAVVVVVR